MPKPVREQLGLKPGDKASFRIKPNGEIVVERLKSFEEIHETLGQPNFSQPLTQREELIGSYLRDKYIKYVKNPR